MASKNVIAAKHVASKILEEAHGKLDNTCLEIVS